MKNKLSVIKAILLSAWLASSLACGSQNQTNGNSANVSVNKTNSNVNAMPMDSIDPKAKNISDAAITLPSPNPVGNAKKQSYTGITIDVPADWKALKKFDSGTASGISFQSPGSETEAIKITVGRSYDAVEGNMQDTFFKDVQKKISSKLILREIDGTMGLLSAGLIDDSYADYLRWETFPPPDSKGYAVKRFVLFNLPNGTYEKNKQLITDILLSAKVRN
jgi:hypothetical protein